ncbi:Z1 domain-containing protein [Rhizobium tumorigenes]|uniref:Z1 domain-containing protein n=1 Tax=Rhizobium tumorigenes TaxID=2041385 RepID=UPI00241C12A0|nr:Z1 domain-containing protein [Rhizobium tumorigenes]WFR99580.1 Z1 domain-containing protein [Rhizobium tumorigenes]
MSEHLKRLEDMVLLYLAAEARPTAEIIRQVIIDLRQSPLFQGKIEDSDAEALARLVEEKNGITMGLGAIVDSADFKPWLLDAKTKSLIEPYYWDRYRRLLAKNGLPPGVVRSTDEVTDKILDRLGDPRDMSDWSRRGMVVGHVQSGKTANYTGLVCKAADAGYRLIVVIAGIHNNLRNQTQGRIDEGFIGRDTARLASRDKGKKQKIIGVGNFDQRFFPVSLTNTIKDFNKGTATTNTSQISSYNVPVILVIKKNSNTLRNLVEWLQEHSVSAGSQLVEQPMLLIDDEADNASINIKHGKEEIARINGQIRELLAIFRRSCYVGYTATPFANIFIDPDREDEVFKQDLFPRHFIIGLDAPTNYFGAHKIFVESKDKHVRFIEDSNEETLPVGHKINHELNVLPQSLVAAVRAFIVARAIRNARGQADKHASMLVNASRFTAMQGKLRNRIADIVAMIRDAVAVDAGKGNTALDNAEIAALHDIWQTEYSESKDSIGWHDVQGRLFEVLAGIQVIEVNSSKTSGALNYDDRGEFGQTVIAVGGFSLSRGLTLEGLTVSYFLRNSVMYDTLMQMGRWFGYRTGYEDLCRIWMLRDGVGWYAHISEAMDELQLDLKRMELANATPEDFGLAVRSHPETLIVTARNKMGSGQLLPMKIGLANRFIETTRLSANSDTLEHNRKIGKSFIDSLRSEGFVLDNSSKVGRGYLVRQVPVALVRDFLIRFRNDRADPLTDPMLVGRYIDERANGELANWDVLLASVNDDDAAMHSEILGIKLGQAERAVGISDLQKGVLAISGSSRRLGSPGDEKVGVQRERADFALRQFEAELKLKGEALPKTIPDRIYRDVRDAPLLILRLVRIKQENPNIPLPTEPVVAWSISFPNSELNGGRVEYVVNTIKMRELFGADEDDDEVAGDAE